MAKTLRLINLVGKRLPRLLPGRRPVYTHSQFYRRKPRAVLIRQIDCGSSNAPELEITALFNPFYDLESYGFHLVASPRHATLLLLTGPLTLNMEAAVIQAFWAMPEPRRVVTVGDGFSPTGSFAGSYAIYRNADPNVVLPPEIERCWIAHIPGDPPSPETILKALLEMNL